MDWNELRYVLAVARTGSLLQAAKELEVSHTTVGRRLKALETELGVLLFERRPDGFVPTPAGHELIEVAERVESDIGIASARVRGQDGNLRGTLRVSTAASLFHAYQYIFADFVQRYPDVDLCLATTSEPVSLAQREADVVTRFSNTPPETWFGRKIGPVQFGVYASRTMAEERGPHAPLSAFPWIGRDGGHNAAWFASWLEENAPSAPIVFRMAYEPVHVAHAVRASIGAQILPCFLADPDPYLTRIAPLDPQFRLDLWLLTLAELQSNRRIRAFMEHMAESLEPHRGELAGEPNL